MRKLMLVTGLVTVLVLAFAVGFTSRASAAQPADDLTVDLDGVWCEDGLAPDLGGRLRLRPCVRVAAAVARACPCRGPLDDEGAPQYDEDGNRIPWKNHGQFVSCVTKKLNDIRAEHENVPDACLQRIQTWAAQSDIGNEGYTCRRPLLRRPIGEKPQPQP